MQWYYVKAGQRVGPLDREALDGHIAASELDGHTLVWRVGLAAWVRAAELPELNLPPPIPPPPLPPGWTAPQAPEAAAAPRFSAPPPPQNASAEEALSYAGFGVRFAAKLLDGLILAGIGLLLRQGLSTFFYEGVLPQPPAWAEWFKAEGVLALLGAAVGIAYSLYFIHKHQATPGKRMLGLRLIRADGGRVGPGRVVGRYFAEQLSALVFFAGYVMAAFDEERRALHDMLCDTRVVRAEKADTRAPRPSGAYLRR